MSQMMIYGVPEGQDARLLAAAARDHAGPVLHIARDDARAGLLQDLLAFFAPDVEVAYFPAWDCLPYDRISPGTGLSAQRVAALTKMLGWRDDKTKKPRLILTTINAALQRVLPRASLKGRSFILQSGRQLNRDHLQEFLIQNGYERADTVREPGEYAVRGGLIDLFPTGRTDPVRLDLFGDQIESLRGFDPLSQRTLEPISDLTLQPAQEVFLDAKSIDRFRSGYRAHFGAVQGNDPLYEAVSEGRRLSGIEHWMPLFYDGLDTLFDYATDAPITLDHQLQDFASDRHTQITDFYEARRTLEKSALSQKSGKSKDVSLTGSLYRPLPPDMLYLTTDEWASYAATAHEYTPFKAPSDSAIDKEGRKGRDFGDIRALPEGDVFAALKDHIQALKRPVLIAAYSNGALERLKAMAQTAGIEKQPGMPGIKYVVLPLEHGFEAPDLAVITESDILGDRLIRRSQRRKKADNFLKEVSSLGQGDLVVHIDHGIGRFVALETVGVGKTLHDCLKIEYAGGDRLFVPVENMEVLTRYGGEDAAVQLDKLGGAGWQARKAKAKKDLMEIAGSLLEIAAARQLQKAESFSVDVGPYNEFAARFPYQETEDQERSIADVLLDLDRDFPMDRLICGDVGFGKTEVAMRAAYVAAMNGAQVAVVVPTTLLARQHFKNFQERFAGLGLRVEQLSRLVSAKEAQRVRAGLAEGHVNVVVGTHALFAGSVKFAHLGLLIIDEEQRFGVKQKEKLKELKKNVHVLSMSATPIPRTLQMALSGVKEMSLITTPPVDRLAIRTFILPFDPVVIKEALMRERHRGGRSFYVCPRIKDIPDLEEALKDLVPDLKTITAHGQMSPAMLEERISAFYDGGYDVLLCTNIIESGIDIAAANTMIVHRADMFGLSQLYQIRGRIGRAKQRAYAYLTYPLDKALNPQALKRLEVMEQLDTLGAGFQLASHDMDIRGAGNLLGEQQSGHIKEIGVELYQQMLEEAVAAAREGADFEKMPDQGWSPQINLGTSVLIPEHYVEDLSVRMSLYRRLSDLESADDVEAFAAELIDRFGDLPPEVVNLLDIVGIKQHCKQAGLSSVEAGPKGAVLAFYQDQPPNVDKLMAWVIQQGRAVKLRPDQKLAVMHDWERTEHRVKGVKNLVRELAGLFPTLSSRA